MQVSQPGHRRDPDGGGIASHSEERCRTQGGMADAAARRHEANRWNPHPKDEKRRLTSRPVAVQGWPTSTTSAPENRYSPGTLRL